MTINFEELREKLIKEKEEIVLILEVLGKAVRDSVSEVVSSSDEIADKYELKQEIHVQKEVLEEKLEKIEQALKRIESGTYGRCTRCGQAIEDARLMIDPAADLCRSCALKTI
ncbi:MAG: TraR/DksA C4-type zinc finger protein [Patescibacteria group bacterium]|nr:TraR/DksA C4-type zinc finger protein [Patescibacteria group bacterium]